MDLALVAARLLLAAVFAVAGLVKLTDRSESRQALTDFGVPPSLAGPLGRALPLAELAVAALLIPAATAWWGALAALGLLIAFTGGIVGNLAQGRAPSCRCFGQLTAGPVGPTTVIRNVVLAGIAGFVAWQGRLDPGPSILGWVGLLSTAEQVTLAIALIVLGLLAAVIFLLLQVVAQQGRLLLRLDALEQGLAATGALARSGDSAEPTPGLPIGVPAPDFRLPDLDRQEVALADLLAAERPVLLVFTDPHCGPCTALLPDVGRWQREQADLLTVAVLSRGNVEESRAKAAEHGVMTVLLQRAYEVADSYQVHETPAAVLVQPDGTIGSAVARGGEQIQALVAQALEGPGAPPWAGLVPLEMASSHHHEHNGHTDSSAARVGEPARSLGLADLDGEVVELADFHGTSTLLLFWSPECGFCQQLLPALRAYEADQPDSELHLLVVSTGSVEANRQMGLRSTVVLDPTFNVGTWYGADGTPSAVLLDDAGRIASPLLVGGPAILAALQPSQHEHFTDRPSATVPSS
jgi:peroxiredoxin